MNKIRLEYALVIARFQYGQYCPCFSYFADLYVINAKYEKPGKC